MSQHSDEVKDAVWTLGLGAFVIAIQAVCLYLRTEGVVLVMLYGITSLCVFIGVAHANSKKVGIPSAVVLIAVVMTTPYFGGTAAERVVLMWVFQIILILLWLFAFFYLLWIIIKERNKSERAAQVKR
jgi:hypothetical protein